MSGAQTGVAVALLDAHVKAIGAELAAEGCPATVDVWDGPTDRDDLGKVSVRPPAVLIAAIAGEDVEECGGAVVGVWRFVAFVVTDGRDSAREALRLAGIVAAAVARLRPADKDGKALPALPAAGVASRNLAATSDRVRQPVSLWSVSWKHPSTVAAAPAEPAQPAATGLVALFPDQGVRDSLTLGPPTERIVP